MSEIENFVAQGWLGHSPWAEDLDSHLAKLASPRATWERTSGCLDLTIPNNALMPPSDLSLICSLSGDKIDKFSTCIKQ